MQYFPDSKMVIIMTGMLNLDAVMYEVHKHGIYVILGTQKDV